MIEGHVSFKPLSIYFSTYQPRVRPSVSDFLVYYFKLPMHLYNTATSQVEPLNPSTSFPPSSIARNFFGAPNSTSLTPNYNSSATSFTSSKMTFMFNFKDKTGTHCQGFYGSFNYFDTQEKINKVFVKYPVLLSYSLLAFHNDTIAILFKCAGKCKFDVFVNEVDKDYVSSGQADPTIDAISIHKNISSFQKDYIEGGAKKSSIPEKLYYVWNSYVANLPDYASKWSIQLIFFVAKFGHKQRYK